LRVMLNNSFVLNAIHREEVYVKTVTLVI
jgi:hypothetical protein